MSLIKSTYIPNLQDVKKAATNLNNVAAVTPLMHNPTYSSQLNCNVMFKREDLQIVRSYKIRGAFNKISSLSKNERAKGVVCASAGNHAQGVAYSCNKLKINGTVYMPSPTPSQKIEQVKMFGNGYVEIILTGDTFDDAQQKAMEACRSECKTFIHPFDDEKVIEGQATVALEILNQTQDIDYLFVPIGGGGLISGMLAVFKAISPKTKIIGVEPAGAPSMQKSLKTGKIVTLKNIDKFVDGAAVLRVGERNFSICQKFIDQVVTVPEGLVCQTILDLYNKDAIVVEPAGALSIATLSSFSDDIEGKNVVCIVSGSNNDITRTAEIKERALLYANLKHYFIVRFPQRAGALKEFVADILGPNDDITHFQYSKKHNKENGPAVVGIELKNEMDLKPLIARMKAHNFYGDYLNNKPDLFQFLV